MQEHNIDKLAEEVLKSFEGAKRAEPKPFLLSRVLSTVSRRSDAKNIWTKAGAFISRPQIAIAGIALIMFINISILLLNRTDTDKTNIIQNSVAATDEFAVNAANIYDIENQEPQ